MSDKIEQSVHEGRGLVVSGLGLVAFFFIAALLEPWSAPYCYIGGCIAAFGSGMTFTRLRDWMRFRRIEGIK